jgi:hypothetical protein
VRHSATLLCEKHPCYLSVGDQPASAELISRLLDLPNIRPTQARSPEGDPVQFFIDLTQPRRLDGAYSVPSRIVGHYEDGERRLFESCTYRLYMADGLWHVDEELSLCLVI